MVEAESTGLSTWKALENYFISGNCSAWRIQDFHFVRGAGTHDHGLGHHTSHLGWLQVAKQDGHTVLHLHRSTKVHVYSSDKPEQGQRVLEFWFTWSRGMCLTSPLTTVLGDGSPTSTCSTYRLSASGCFSALIIRPTRRSRRDTSTLASSWLGVACFFSALSPPSAEERTVSLD